MSHRKQKLKERKQAQHGNDLMKNILQTGLDVLHALCMMIADSPKAPFFLRDVWDFIAGSALWSWFIVIVGIHAEETEISHIFARKFSGALQALWLRRELSSIFWRGKTLSSRSVCTKEKLRRTFCSYNKPPLHHTDLRLRKIWMSGVHTALNHTTDFFDLLADHRKPICCMVLPHQRALLPGNFGWVQALGKA
jgi:hypothetical protein